MSSKYSKYTVKRNGKEIQSIMRQIMQRDKDENKYYISKELMEKLILSCDKMTKNSKRYTVKLEWTSQFSYSIKAEELDCNKVYCCSCYRISKVTMKVADKTETIVFSNPSLNEKPDMNTLFFCTKEDIEQ